MITYLLSYMKLINCVCKLMILALLLIKLLGG